MEIHYIDSWPQPYSQMDAAPYWAALQEEGLTFQRCTDCRETVWPAKSHCPNCGKRALVWEGSKGKGKVYSFSTIMRGPTPAWQAIVPYTVGFVEMEEGYILFTQFDCAPDAIKIGDAVSVRYIKRGEQTLPIFGPAS
ncbi:OB-fold domain-containing protein [Bosea sp. ASV33]|uniref:Zn-ribbon domain-containing OB-fold protein n=1 Tax=Bosea sp. ASV33 TaxID=2795106 RepID=UPI0018EE3B49|nr:OB-fold domain-containing protein [Bosea sp. ASV33]